MVGWGGGAREAREAGVGARRTIFFDWRVRSGRGSVNGGLMMPSFGDIRNFWFVVGMDNSLSMRFDRSAMVDSGGKLKECDVP